MPRVPRHATIEGQAVALAVVRHSRKATPAHTVPRRSRARSPTRQRPRPGTKKGRGPRRNPRNRARDRGDRTRCPPTRARQGPTRTATMRRQGTSRPRGQRRADNDSRRFPNRPTTTLSALAASRRGPLGMLPRLAATLVLKRRANAAVPRRLARPCAHGSALARGLMAPPDHHVRRSGRSRAASARHVEFELPRAGAHKRGLRGRTPAHGQQHLRSRGARRPRAGNASRPS